MTLTISQINKIHPKYGLNADSDVLVDMSDEYVEDELRHFCDVNDEYELTEQNYFVDEILLLLGETPQQAEKLLPYRFYNKIWNIHFTLSQDYMQKQLQLEQLAPPSLHYVDDLPNSPEEAAASRKYFTVYLLKFPINDKEVTVLRFEYNNRDRPLAYYNARRILKSIFGA